MIAEKANQYFQQYKELRVLFLFDPEGSLEEEVSGIAQEAFQVVKNKGNYLQLKYLLHFEMARQKVLLYCPIQSPRKQEEMLQFPLMDLLLANKELILDDEGELIRRYNLEGSKRTLLKEFKKELKFAAVQQALHPILSAPDFKRKDLARGLFSVFLRFKTPQSPQLLLAKILTLYLDPTELKRFQNKLSENRLFPELEVYVKKIFDIKLDQLDTEGLEVLLRFTKYNLLTQLLPAIKEEDPYKHLLIKNKQCILLLNQVLDEAEKHEGLGAELKRAIAAGGESIHELKLMDLYGNTAEFGYTTERMNWRLIADWIDKMESASKATVEKVHQRMLKKGHSEIQQRVMEFIRYGCELMIAINSVRTFVLDRPEEYASAYVSDWYKIDYAYRKLIAVYRKIDQSDVPDSLQFEKIVALLNKRYESFLDKSNREWLACLNEIKFDYRQLTIPKQYDFFKHEVASSEQKIVVVISDALRYEAALELLSELHSDPKNTADIHFRLASIPSKTSVGMAQLLPGKSLSFNEGKIQLDGVSTEGLVNREAILKAFTGDAMAVSLSESNRNSQEKNRQVFKAKLVYVYHDGIDAIGDDRRSEDKTFSAVEDAIQELKIFVKKLHSSYNISKVIVTADHGFIYNDRAIEEQDKESGFDLDAIQKHNRYEVTRTAISPERGYCIPLKATTAFSDDLYVSIPKAVNRIKRQGVGHQFVHGGGSLQELIIPVITSTRKRDEVAIKVQPVLVNRDRLRIVSNLCKVTVLQQSKLSRTEKERVLKIGLYKGLDIVSNQVPMTLNSTADNPIARTQEAQLVLANTASNESVLKLKIFDADDMLNPLIEENVNNSSLIARDF